MAAVDLHPDIIQAIRGLAHTRLGRKFDRFSRRRYGISGKRLAAKQTAGESGGRMGAVSPAGARGATQFMPATRQEMIRRFGIDPWRSPKEAEAALMRYDLEHGVGGYNPGMPTYTKYVLGTKISPGNFRALQGGGTAGGGTPGFTVPGPTSHSVTLGTKTIPGQSFAPERQALKDQLLLGRGGLTMKKLLAYKEQLNSLKDVPAQTQLGDLKVTAHGGGQVAVPGSPAAGNRQPANASHTLNQMFRIAQDVDKLNNQGKVPYAWGGGHGAAPAKAGTPVDCSGFVSQILGVSPRTSGQFAASWGLPGRGKWVTVYANPEHVLVAMRDPRTRKVRWFATSRSNPGGGAGEIAKPDAAYLARFTKRHPG